MLRLLWVLAWIAVAVWSLVAFAGYGLVDVLGGVLARNADMLSDRPETVETLFKVLNGLKSFGLAAILLVWGAVSLAILGVPWFVSRAVSAPRDLGLDRPGRQRPGGLFGPRSATAGGPARPADPGPRPAEPGVIDLTPDQYASDRRGAPRPPEPRGSVPPARRGG